VCKAAAEASRWWSLLDRPWIALAAVVLGWSCAVVFASAGPTWLGAAPLAVWDESSLGTTWKRDAGDRWAYAVHAGFAAADSPGVWVDVEPGRAGEVQVQLRWRSSDDATWQIAVVPHHLSRDHVFFDLSHDPSWRGIVRQLFVAIVHDADLPVRRIVLERYGAIAALRRALREVASGELFGGQSTVNVLHGPTLLGVSLTLWIAATLGVLIAIEIVAARTAGRAIRFRRVLLALCCGWLVLDLRFSVDLATNAAADWLRYPTLAEADAVATFGGPQFRAMVESVRAHVPPDASMAILSNDPLHVIRAKYLFYPRTLVGPLRLRNWRRPDYIVIYRYSALSYDSAKGILTLGNGRRFRVEQVDARPGMGLMRVLRGLPRQRGMKKP